MKLIRKSALVIVKDNKLLVVRTKGSSYFLMPGGKPKEGESAIAALQREIMEELSCSIDKKSITLLGTFQDIAADSRDAEVSIDLYSGKLVGEAKPSSEVEELVWISAAEINHPRLSPIIRNKILPFLVEKKMLSKVT